MIAVCIIERFWARTYKSRAICVLLQLVAQANAFDYNPPPDQFRPIQPQPTDKVNEYNLSVQIKTDRD